MMKIIKKLMTNVFFIIIIVLLVLGYFHYVQLTKKSTIFSNFTSNIGNMIKDYIDIPSKYDLGDNFEVSSKVDVNLESKEFEEKSYEDPEYYKKYKLLKNLSELDSSYSLKQSKEKGQLLFTFDNKIGQEDLYSGKVYIENSTQYYMVNKILNNYVNEGNNSYFETLTHSNTTIDNIDYIYQIILNSIKKNIRDEELKEEKKDLVINNKKINTRQISLKITDKYYKVLLKRILNDLKKDERSNLILESIIPDFESIEVDDEKVYLEKNEYYTVNIYMRSIWNTPVKYEVIHTKENEENTLSILGNFEKGTIYYYHNDELKYTSNYQITPKIIEIIVNNEKETAGFIKLEKSNNSLSLNINLALEDENIDLSFSCIYKNYKKNTSYKREDNLNIKWLRNDKTLLSGTVSISTDVTNSFKIMEDVEDSLLRLTLEDDKNEALDHSLEEFKNRLER